MAWNIDYKRLAIPAVPTDIITDGGYVWVVAGKIIYVYDYWKVDTNYEDGLYDMQYYPDYGDSQTVESLVLVDTIDLTLDIGTDELLEITKVYDHMYVSNKVTPTLPNHSCSSSTKVFKINIATRTYVSTINIPFIAHSNIAGGFNRIWFTDEAVTDFNVAQKIYYMDVTNGIWSAGEAIGIQKQFTKHHISNGLNYWMLIDAFNQIGIAKINGVTGTFDGLIVTNRSPTHIKANNDHSVMVTSAGGMVTIVDQTLETASNLYSSFERASHIVDDGTYLWSLTPELTRTIKATTTDNIKYTATGDEGFKLAPFDGVIEFRDLLLTEEFTYEFWNGSSFDTRTVKSYIFVLDDAGITNFRNTSWYRSNTFSIRGTGMIAVGPDGYFGETTEVDVPPENLIICV